MHRHTLFQTVVLALLAPFMMAAAGCGSRQDPEQAPPPSTVTSQPTPYGSATDLSAYLEALQPHVTRLGQLQSQYEEALASATQGTTERRGTGRNLAAMAEQVLPGFRQVLADLEALAPPPLLAPFHRDARKMVTTRIESLQQTTQGWRVEQEGGDFEALYRQAETGYRAANDLTAGLNAEVERMQAALLKATGAG